MSKVITRLGTGVAVVALGGVGSVLAAPAATAAQGLQTLDCGGQEVVISVGDSHSSDNGGWGAARIVDGGSGTLIPTSFTFSVYDETLDQELFTFTQPNGGGHAHGQQDTISCTETESGTVADLLEPGETPPEGVDLDDEVTSTFTVTAVARP
jgi:hypothetical protein